MEPVTIACILLSAAAALLVYASASVKAGFYLKCRCRMPGAENGSGPKIAALTFDDGPHPGQTPKVLDVLKRYNVPASFFLVGNRAEAAPEIVRRIAEEGHLIGNHSLDHRGRFPIYRLREMRTHLAETSRILERISGERIRYFRPPFGVTNPTVARAVRQEKLIPVGWDVRSLDTCRSREKAVRSILRKTRPGSILLLHDPLPESHLLLEEVILRLRERGYRFVRADFPEKQIFHPEMNKNDFPGPSGI